MVTFIYYYLFYLEKKMKKKNKKQKNNRFRKQKLHFKRKNKLSEIIQNFSTLIEYIIEYITMFYVVM